MLKRSLQIGWLLVMLAPLPALAQQGFQFVPGITLSEAYDDDLAPAGPKAIFTELSPTTTLGYGSERFSLVGHAALDAEAADAAPFAQTPFLRFASDAQLMGRLTDRLTFNANGTFWDTNTPRDINVLTGIDPGAERANAESGEASFDYWFTQRVRGQIDGSFLSSYEGGLTTDEETAKLSLHRQWTERTGLRFDLVGRRFEFLGHENDDNEIAMAGFDHKFTPELSLELLAGPRFMDKSAEGLEGSATLLWKAETVHVSANLASTQTAVAGFIGTVDTESASLQVLVHPAEKLFFSLTPSGFISSGAPLKSQVLTLDAELLRPLNDYFAFVASYRLTVEHSTYNTADASGALADASSNGSSVHNMVLVGISLHAKASEGLPYVGPLAGAWDRKPAVPPPPSSLPLPLPGAPLNQNEPLNPNQGEPQPNASPNPSAPPPP